MHRKHTPLLAGLAAIVVLAGSVVPVIAAADEDDHKTRIHIRKMGDGDETVVHREHKAIFVGEDGEVTELHGEGKGHAWVMRGDGETFDFSIGAFGPGGFLGVGTTELTSELRSHFGVPEDQGVMVSRVVEDSGAFRAGLLVGDIITAIDGEPVSSAHGLQRAIRERAEGDSVVVELWRDGKAQNLTAILGETEGARHFPVGDFGRLMRIDCDEGNDDCNIWMSRHHEVCGSEGSCDIKVTCEDDVCTCEVDGEVTDCDELEGVHVRHHD